MPESLDAKRAMRAQLMRLLYEDTNGSPLAVVAERDLGKKLGWDEGTTNLVTEYLLGEGLLEYVAMGGSIGITHRGVVEVEDALREPTEPTNHFAAFNQITIESAMNVAVQQGTTDSTQNVTNISQERRNEILGLLGEVDEVVRAWPQDNPVRVEAEEAVNVARTELKAGSELGRVRSALSAVAGVITKGAALGRSAEVLFALIGKLLKAA